MPPSYLRRNPNPRRGGTTRSSPPTATCPLAAHRLGERRGRRADQPRDARRGGRTAVFRSTWSRGGPDCRTTSARLRRRATIGLRAAGERHARRRTLDDRTLRFGCHRATYEPDRQRARSCWSSRSVYTPLAGVRARPQRVVGRSPTRRSEPFLGDPDAVLATLLPVEPAFDMAVNVFTFQPGAALPLVETHVMEHGLQMAAGAGRLPAGRRCLVPGAGGRRDLDGVLLPAVVRRDGQVAGGRTSTTKTSTATRWSLGTRDG